MERGVAVRRGSGDAAIRAKDEGDADRRSGVMRPGSRRASDGGQAGVEHVAVVALVVLVLGGATLAAPGSGAGIVNAVHSGIRRALCVAGGDRCAAFHDERPCLVRRDEQRQAKALTVAFVRIGARVGVVREQWSDGRTTVTVHDDFDAGATLGVGAELALGGGPGIELSASATGTVRGGWGRSWTFERSQDADRLMRRVLDGRESPGALQGLERGIDALLSDGALPRPDSEGIRLGRERVGRAAVRAPGVALDATLLEQLEGEVLYDHRDGRLTVALALAPDVRARLTGPLRLELEGRLAGDAQVAVVLDRDLRPLELRLLGALRAGEGRREQAELRVDLTRPRIGEALRGLLGAVRDGAPGRAVREAAELGRWAAAEGAIERRTYRVAGRDGTRGGSLALGAKLGYETTDAASEWRLERAATKPPGGIWEQRVNCVAGSS
jgi:hypothetical protein